MALELNKLTGQVDVMGRAMAQRSGEQRQRIARAKDTLARTPLVTAELRAKIKRAREIDQWRRGALPLGDRLDDRRQVTERLPQAILIAADGSQIYPDRHGIALYYLLNTGAIVLRAGSGQAPSVDSAPEIFYRDEDLYDADGQIHPPEHINAQRSRREIQALADLAEAERTALGGDLSVPIICLTDGPLLPWQKQDAEHDETISEEVEFFVQQIRRLRNARAIPVGYVDRPGSAYVLRILELVDLPIEQITREKLRRGSFLLLADRFLFDDLRPNERGALFTPNSETNDRYEQASGGDRIVFTYVNLSRQDGVKNSAVVRMEIPKWVADDPTLLDAAQAA
ncbi:MAG: NurA protein, partial [Chloroflexota bacterium]|nr:NurA protein [Chloroflexota bacterium]